MDFPRFQLFEREAAKSCRLKQLVSRGPTLATNSQLLSALVIQRHAAKHLLSPRCIHRPVHTKRVLAHGTHVKVCTYVGKVAVQCARSARHVVYRAPWSMGATRPSGSAESRLNSLPDQATRSTVCETRQFVVRRASVYAGTRFAKGIG